MRKTYDIIYSIGRDCSCASYLSNNSLRITSGPFDWLTNVNEFEKRVNIILNDFDRFLEISDLKIISKNPHIINDEKCDYYENVYNGFYYYHDFLAGVPLEQSFDKVKEKYERRIKRFINNIQTQKHVLLVWFSHIPTTNNDEKVVLLCEKLCKKFNKSIDFLIIEHDETKKQNEIKKINLADNITKYNLYTRSWDSTGALTTMGREDICSMIFKKYSLKKSLKDRLRNILKNIFSIYNSQTKQHKIICILGIKLKVKRTCNER